MAYKRSDQLKPAPGEQRPDVVLMDIRMPVMSGIEATGQILERDDAIRVLILTTFDLDDYVYDALVAGASGFMLKDATAAQLLEAVRVVARGDALLAPSITKRLITTFSRQHRKPLGQHKLDELTERETEVLRLVAEGLSNSEIRARLVVSDNTVKTHINRLFGKLGLRDRAQAVIFAYESGLVTPSEQ